MIDPKLYDYATPRQREVMEAIERTGSGYLAAEELQCHRSLPNKTLARVREKAATEGYAPGHWTDGVAPGYVMGKVTIERKDENGLKRWERQHPAQVGYAAAIREALDTFEPVTVALPPRGPEAIDTDVIPWLQIGDAHIGMLAHEAETGANFDVKIAVEEITTAAAALIAKMPRCERMVVNDLGDGTHYENYKAMTEGSGHVLDFDTRFPKMIRAYINSMLSIIDVALQRADTVDVIINRGNHSETNDVWMAELVKIAYRKSNRVNVLSNDGLHIAYRMGNTFVLVHHGHKTKPAALARLMADDYGVDWGETTFRYIDGGHVHHRAAEELAGVIHESWNNLAPRDRYAHEGGWRSKQAMSIVMRSRTYGELGRYKMPVEKVRDMIRARGVDHYVPPVMRAFAA